MLEFHGTGILSTFTEHEKLSPSDCAFQLHFCDILLNFYVFRSAQAAQHLRRRRSRPTTFGKGTRNSDARLCGLTLTTSSTSLSCSQ